MKNIFRFLMAVAVLFTASCAKEDISSSIGGGEVEVTFTANLPELGTRAYGDGTKATTLRYYVFDGDNYLPGISSESLPEKKVTLTNGKAVVTLPLLKGMIYNIIFWADKDGCYSINTDYKTVTVDYTGAYANDDNRDAFYKYLSNVDPTNAVEIKKQTNVTLTRPFGQLNAATSDFDAVENNEVALTTSALTVTANTTLDLTTGIGSNSQTFSFEPTVIPAETLKDGYKYLSMNYLIPGNVDVEYTFNATKASGPFAFTDTSYTNVPVKANYRTNILGALLTNSTDFTVTIEENFFKPDENIVPVATTKELQEALDNAVANTEIRLAPGVNYGTVLIRPVAGAANTITDCDYLVYRNEMRRKVENLTIVGAEGAKVEAFKVVAGHIEGSTGYVVDIKNLVIDGVEFNDTYTNAPHSYAAPIFFDLTYTNVDGLTVQNCELISKKKNNDKMNFVYIYGSGNPDNSTFETASKNIKIINNTVDGIARLCELRQTENVTITGNTIKNTALHGILLPVDNGTYSGNVTITENKAYNIGDRFVRMAGAGDAIVEITNNNIYNYGGEDADFIKVTDGNEDNITIENNNLVTEVASWDEFTAALAAGKPKVKLTADINYDNIYTLTKNVDIDLNGHTLGVNTGKYFGIKATATIKNGQFNGIIYAQSGSTTLNNIKFGGEITFISAAQAPLTIAAGDVYVKDCDFSKITLASGSTKKPNRLSVQSRSSGSIELVNCNFNNYKFSNAYINPQSGSASLKFTSCKFGNTTNIETKSLANFNLSGNSGGFAFIMNNFTLENLPDSEKEYYSTIKNNKNGTVRIDCSNGSYK